MPQRDLRFVHDYIEEGGPLTPMQAGPGHGAAVSEGPGIDLAGSSVGLGGDTVLLYDSGGAPVAEYERTSAGLSAALAAASAGDVVWLPAGTIDGDHTVPAGVTVMGMGDNSVLSGTITLGEGATLIYLTVGTSAVLFRRSNSGSTESLEVFGTAEFVCSQDADHSRFRMAAPADQDATLQLYTQNPDGSYQGWALLKDRTDGSFHLNRDDSENTAAVTVITVDLDGHVGIMKTDPGEALDVHGNIRSDGQLISTVETGTAPAAVDSTTLVTNLNADMVDGLHAADLAGAGDGSGQVYLMSCHRETDQSLYLLVSRDGLTWEALSDTALYTPASGVCRDPSIMYHDGLWWLAYTGGTTVDQFGVAYSENLVDWTFHCHVSTAALSGVDYTWAPEWFVDDDDSVHVFVALTDDNRVTHAIYELHPTNAEWTTWSSPVEVTGTGFPSNMIDPFVVKVEGTYYLFYKYDVGLHASKHIDWASSTSLTSGYTVVGHGEDVGWTNGVEGPSLVQMGSTWRIYYDDYVSVGTPGNGIFYSDSQDDFATWTDDAYITTPFIVQHPTVVRYESVEREAEIEHAWLLLQMLTGVTVEEEDGTPSVANVNRIQVPNGTMTDDGGGTVSLSYAATSHTHAAADITSGRIATARLGSGTASAATYLRGDQTWAAAGGAELLMQDGVTAPPVPLETEGREDWLYEG